MADQRLNSEAQALVDHGSYVLFEGEGGPYLMPAFARPGGQMKFAGGPTPPVATPASTPAPPPPPPAPVAASPPTPEPAPPVVEDPAPAPVEQP